jgi:PAP2 superfamily protein
MKSSTPPSVLGLVDGQPELPVKSGCEPRPSGPALSAIAILPQITVKILFSTTVLTIVSLAARHLVLTVPFMDYTAVAAAVLFFRNRARLPMLVGLPFLVWLLQFQQRQRINLHGALTLVGLAFIVLMAIYAIWKPQSKHRTDALLTSAMIVFTTAILAALLFEGQRLPFTTDLYLYALDGRFGFQPSFAIGKLLTISPLLHRFVEINYGAVPVMLIVAYAWSDRGKQLLLACSIAPILAVMCFPLVPAVGPVYVFADFPHSAPAMAPHPIEIPASQARDCLPSMHMAWAIFVYLACRGTRRIIWFGAYCVFVTIISTLGLGEHYLVDLIVAFPFALIVWYACALVFGMRNTKGQGTLIESQLTGNELP